MNYLKGIETAVLISILKAQVDYYGKVLTPGHANDCLNMIRQLQNEITSRGEAINDHDRALFEGPALMHFSNHDKMG